jgi:hypothetical protein
VTHFGVLLLRIELGFPGLCSSFPILLGALFNGARHCFMILFSPFSIGFMLKAFTCLGPLAFGTPCDPICLFLQPALVAYLLGCSGRFSTFSLCLKSEIGGDLHIKGNVHY